MATIVGVDCTDGVLLAGDRTVLRDGTVVGSRRHVYDFDDAGFDVGAAVVVDGPDAFRRRLEAALREYSTEHGTPGIDAVSRIAAEIVGDTGVEALVAAHDDAGVARLRSIDGGVSAPRIGAAGSAAAMVLARLDAVDETGLDDVELRVREAFRAAASRDPGTGAELDVYRLVDASSGETV